jgi:hypothetical protein
MEKQKKKAPKAARSLKKTLKRKNLKKEKS